MISVRSVFTSLTQMKPKEQRSAFLAFLIIFILMASYFILRPVRDAMASDWSDAEVSLLWNIQFFLSIAIVGVYSFLVSRLNFRWIVPVVYGAFSLSFLFFYLLTPKFANPVLIEKGFYLWVTAFSLLNLSVFWSFMSSLFTQEQSQRLFAFIGSGASAGAILGPAIPVLFSKALGVDVLMLMASLGLALVVPLTLYLNGIMQAQAPLHGATAIPSGKIGGKWWDGFSACWKNPYLLVICLFLLLYVFTGSFVYFQQKNLLAEFSRPERAQILGGIDWIVNVLTFVVAFAVTSRIVRNLGMGATLASVPLVLVVGLIVLAFAPVVVILLAVQVVRRVGNYSVTRPAREMLFTRVTTSERYKAKPVIDVVVYRGGDAVGGMLFALLTEGIGLGFFALSMIGAAIASCWAFVGVVVGRLYRSENTRTDSTSNAYSTSAIDRL